MNMLKLKLIVSVFKVINGTSLRKHIAPNYTRWTPVAAGESVMASDPMTILISNNYTYSYYNYTLYDTHKFPNILPTIPIQWRVSDLNTRDAIYCEWSESGLFEIRRRTLLLFIHDPPPGGRMAHIIMLLINNTLRGCVCMFCWPN